MKSRTVKLNTSESAALELLWKTAPDYRLRQRCHAILLSGDGFNMKQLSKVFKVDRSTVREWLDRWESAGIDGLRDQPKSGRPPIFDEAEKKNPR